MLQSGHLEHFLSVAVCGSHIDKWRWSYDPPGGWSMIWLLAQLLGENMKKFVLGLHQVCANSENETNAEYLITVNICSNQYTTGI